MAETLLALDDVRAGYGDAVVLDGITLAVAEAGSLAVLGRNGVGKSTLLLTIMGFTRVSRGAIANICCSPPERWLPRLPRRSRSRGNKP